MIAVQPQVLPFDKIKQLYPDEWVLIGNPVLKDPQVLGSVVSKLVEGVVLYHSKDKREIAYKAKELRQSVSTTACVYTGTIPKNRKFWL